MPIWQYVFLKMGPVKLSRWPKMNCAPILDYLYLYLPTHPLNESWKGDYETGPGTGQECFEPDQNLQLVHRSNELRHEKTNVLVSNLARHKPGCTTTEDG